LLWLLPVAWMVICFDVFRRAEPSADYTNSVIYLFLGCIWLFSVKKLKVSLPARRARMWTGAAILCATALLTGLIAFRLYPMRWACWFVFFPSLLVLANTLAGESSQKSSPS